MAQYTAIRTQGDGMENNLDLTKECLDKSNPVTTCIQNGMTAVHFVPKNAIQYKTMKPLGNVKAKEPRFVPYEPYKAAVTPMFPCGQMKDKKQVKELASVVRKLSVEAGLSLPDGGIRQWENEKTVLQNEITFLKDELLKLEGQLKFQAQVNCDLKTLLVAAVGEDLEMRVQLLTEDKLQLARALLSSAEVCTSHEERSEYLVGQCEVWRSKFLASSLMLEDLSHRKNALIHHAAQLEEVTKKLLDEKISIVQELEKTYKSLRVLQDGFAPGTTSDLPAMSTTLDLAEANQRLGYSLRQQLLGGRPTVEPSLMHLSLEGATELTARKLLGGIVQSLGASDAACNAVMEVAMAMATRQPACCSHCKGDVKTV